MDQLGLGWLGELSKQGLGYLLTVLSWVIIFFLDKRNQACMEQSRKDANAVAGALEKANEIMTEIARSQPELMQAQREFALVLQAAIKQQDKSDLEARDRANDIIRAMQEKRGPSRG